MRKLLAVFLILSACAQRPEPLLNQTEQLFFRLDGLAEQSDHKAVWFALSDYQSTGHLARWDMETGNVHWQKRNITTDVSLQKDNLTGGLFVLVRNGQDSIQLFQGKDAELVYDFPLETNENPQAVARDGSGNVWLASLDRNSVRVLDSELQSELIKIDLDVLNLSQDSYAEIYDLALADTNTMVVVAANLNRPSWLPSAQSKIAFIDTQSFGVSEIQTLDMPNLARVFSANNGEAVAVGYGAQIATHDAQASMLRLNANKGLAFEQRKLQSRIIDADQDTNGEIISIQWQPKLKQSCIVSGLQTFLCEPDLSNGAAAFFRVLATENYIFLNYADFQSPQLWVLDRKNNQLSKLSLPMPLLDMSFGP